MRSILLCGAAFFSLAMTEPKPINEGESRVGMVPWHDGIVVKSTLARGQTFLLEVERGFVVYSIAPSEQDVMDEKKVDGEENERGEPGADAGANAVPSDCAMFANIRICTKLDRFVYFTPITTLDPQPVHLIVMKERKNLPALEYPVIVEIQTGERNLYSVRLKMPEPPAPPPRPVSRRSSRASNAYVPPVAPPPVNRAYTIEGDKTLIGEPGR